jgi:hypothetical protein
MKPETVTLRVQFHKPMRIGSYESTEAWHWNFEVTAWVVEDSGALRLELADGHTWIFAPHCWVSVTTDLSEELSLE